MIFPCNLLHLQTLGSGPTICDPGTGAIPLESTQGDGVQIQQQRLSPEDVHVGAFFGEKLEIELTAMILGIVAIHRI